jgi:hypothetical protein
MVPVDTLDERSKTEIGAGPKVFYAVHLFCTYLIHLNTSNNIV